MAHTWTRHWYGNESWQWFDWGQPTGVSSTLPGVAFIPGGGWGLRDPFGYRNPATGEVIFRGALNNPSSSLFKTYQNFIVNVASNNHNGSTVVPCFPWLTTRYYDVGDVVQVSTSDTVPSPQYQYIDKKAYVCKLAHTAAASTNKPGSGSSWATNWDELTNKEVVRSGRGAVQWATGIAYAVDDVIYSGPDGATSGSGRVYRCVSAHTSGTSTRPGIGASTATVWVEVPSNSLGAPRLQHFGETTPAYALQGAVDAQLFMAYVRAEAATFKLTPNKLALMGSSAGGWNAAMAAFSPPLNYSGVDEPFGASPSIPRRSSRPNALILSITPTDISRYMTADVPGQQGQMLNFMRSIFGREELSTFAGWAALPLEIKKMMSPHHVLSKVGLSCPVYMLYPFDDKSSTTEAFEFNGSASPASQPDPHAARNGWALFEILFSGNLAGGFQRTDCLYLERHDASNLKRYTLFSASGGTLGTHYTLIGNGTQTLGEDIVNWLNGVM